MAKPSVHDTRAVDPKDAGPKPEYPQQPIDPPGSDSELTPQADHGEETYAGLGRLTDKVALVTGGDSGHRHRVRTRRGGCVDLVSPGRRA
jgi:hypothetical protein